MNETLSDFVRRVMRDDDLTFQKVEEQSGGEMKAATVSDIVQERNTNPTVKTLKALALGLRRPESLVFDVARGAKVMTDDAKRDRFIWMYESLPPMWQEEELARLEFVSKRHGQSSAQTPANSRGRGKHQPVGAPENQRIPVVKLKHAPEKLKKEK